LISKLIKEIAKEINEEKVENVTQEGGIIVDLSNNYMHCLKMKSLEVRMRPQPARNCTANHAIATL
jgi:ribosomal protein L12E/L44/L45/RPP1/RPP2